MKSTPRLRIAVLLALIVVALASSLWAVWPWPTGDWKGLALNFGTEMAGAVVTYLLLELVIGRIEKRETEEKELEAKKARLIAQMGSQVQDVAVAAVEELRRCGWLTDGSLRGAKLDHAKLPEGYLAKANLEGASLTWANLQGARLAEANLQGAQLFSANLQKARLFKAKLQGAQLSANLQGVCLRLANLEGAELRGTNLQGAHLPDANLQGADLSGANLKGAQLFSANLKGAKFSKRTTLPDGTRWTSHTDMARFTNPKHPDYWRSKESS